MWPILLIVTALVYRGPIQQKESYHNFADARCACAVPNVWNVVSNLPFLLASLPGGDDAPPPWKQAFSIGLIMTAFGSSYYHWRPSTRRLVFDRLGMSVCFGSIIHRSHSPTYFPDDYLWLIICLSVMSVLDWAWTGDLRLYIACQYGGILSIILCAEREWWTPVGLYVAAKVCERFDREIYTRTRN